MSSTCYFCRPADILTAAATLSLTAGAADAAFPLTNLQDGRAHTVFKSTGNAATIRSTFGSPVTLEAVAVHFHKLAGATVDVTNGAGLDESLVIPANTPDGHCLDPWLDLRGFANLTSDIWDLEITGAATVVAIGELLWIETIREFEVQRGIVQEEELATVVHAGDYHPRIAAYHLGSRVRAFQGHLTPKTSADELLTLHRGAKGPLTPFWLVPDSTVNDALYGHLIPARHQFVESFPRGSGARETDVEFVEALRGLPL